MRQQIEKDPRLLEAVNSWGDTALIKSAELGHLGAALFLLKKGARIEGKNRQGQSPLMFALKLGRLHVAQALIEKGADIHSSDLEGLSPLMVSAGLGDLPGAWALIRAEAKVDQTDRLGRNALMHAALSFNKGAPSVIEELIRAGADPNAVNGSGHTALMMALKAERLNNARALKKGGALLSIFDQSVLWQKGSTAQRALFREFLESACKKSF